MERKRREWLKLSHIHFVDEWQIFFKCDFFLLGLVQRAEQIDWLRQWFCFRIVSLYLLALLINALFFCYQWQLYISALQVRCSFSIDVLAHIDIDIAKGSIGNAPVRAFSIHAANIGCHPATLLAFANKSIKLKTLPCVKITRLRTSIEWQRLFITQLVFGIRSSVSIPEHVRKTFIDGVLGALFSCSSSENYNIVEQAAAHRHGKSMNEWIELAQLIFEITEENPMVLSIH